MENVISNMWSKKMKTILMRVGCVKAIDDSWLANLPLAKKTGLEEVAWILSFCIHLKI